LLLTHTHTFICSLTMRSQAKYLVNKVSFQVKVKATEASSK